MKQFRRQLSMAVVLSWYWVDNFVEINGIMTANCYIDIRIVNLE